MTSTITRSSQCLSFVATLTATLTLVACGAAGGGDTKSGQDAVADGQGTDVNVDDATERSGDADGIECTQDTNGIGWCATDLTVVFCDNGTWYEYNCQSFSDDEVCGRRPGESFVTCDLPEKFEGGDDDGDDDGDDSGEGEGEDDGFGDDGSGDDFGP